jgi:hypothetical protein
MDDLQALFDSMNPYLDKHSDRSGLLTNEIQFIELLNELNFKKTRLRTLYDFDTLLSGLRQLKDNLQSWSSMEELIQLNDSLFTVQLRCRMCNETKLKKEFLLSLKCQCMCAVCTCSAVLAGYTRCNCNVDLMPDVWHELDISTMECGGCFKQVQLMRSESLCGRHRLCAECIRVASEFQYCFLCKH